MAVKRRFASMTGAIAKGGFVNLPLALADGLHNVPQLYGDKPRAHGKLGVRKSGGIIATKVGLAVR
ncbi:uncharacterized protein ColSpa_05525 [Colletotrichum spaethianum]|uniref:Uncharacterized protein n=1 Tax=Colletotrichum spaethianum TaxID=700344 RepID=A0AA37LF93_9PEZI|nr:uncharacterized protein ColSpa_05525 [Colletotrichum spaethianum]GKT45344.1 hypothetical protein ColSpa_05525 [Colletotrichum spaethianum]